MTTLNYINVKTDYKPLEMTHLINEDIHLLNENNEVFNTLTLYNKSMLAIAPVLAEQVIEHYNTKYELTDIMKAMYNKYKVKGIYELDEIQRLENLMKDWIVKDTILTQFRYIYKAHAKDNHIEINAIIMNIMYYVKYSIPKLDSNDFYLFESYL